MEAETYFEGATSSRRVGMRRGRVMLAWVVVGEAEPKSLLVFENVVESKAGCEGFSPVAQVTTTGS